MQEYTTVNDKNSELYRCIMFGSSRLEVRYFEPYTPEYVLTTNNDNTCYALTNEDGVRLHSSVDEVAREVTLVPEGYVIRIYFSNSSNMWRLADEWTADGREPCTLTDLQKIFERLTHMSLDVLVRSLDPSKVYFFYVPLNYSSSTRYKRFGLTAGGVPSDCVYGIGYMPNYMSNDMSPYALERIEVDNVPIREFDKRSWSWNEIYTYLYETSSHNSRPMHYKVKVENVGYITSSTIQSLQTLRGNVSNTILYRYNELTGKSRLDLLRYYPELVHVTNLYENLVDQLYKDMYRIYQDLYIYKHNGNYSDDLVNACYSYSMFLLENHYVHSIYSVMYWVDNQDSEDTFERIRNRLPLHVKKAYINHVDYVMSKPHKVPTDDGSDVS